MSGPFGQSNVDCTGDTLEVVNSAFTLATMNDGQKYILGINQAFCHLDPYQNEALLAPHQCRDNGVIVDNCAKRHSKEGANGETIPLVHKVSRYRTIDLSLVSTAINVIIEFRNRQRKTCKHTLQFGLLPLIGMNQLNVNIQLDVYIIMMILLVGVRI